ncbi:MAG: hypothetical protein QNJ55_06245 [Xenococcus sp. MO_188.B8]|nr:hypothetical protein [Xenococcus sp. MO_188.B8]
MKLINKNLGLETFLKLGAVIVLISILLKAIIDVDTNYDTWWYHLPFAARIWGIIPQEMYQFNDAIENRFDGVPLLGEFLQGFFWFITQRVQAANLVCFFSLIIYLYFLKAYFQIPLYLSAIALLAIPAVLTHATTCFVDLPGNIGVSMLVMMTYLLYQRRQLPTKLNLLVIFLAAASAVNIKPHLQPLTFLLLCFIGLRIIWLYFTQAQAPKKWLLKAIPISLVASLLIFATPIKNIALYGNPFYPIKVEIAGKVLNHTMVPGAYKRGSRPQKWLQSILEINTPSWSADQWNRNDPKYMDRGGGFFGAYVVFNLLLLGFFFLHEQLQSRHLKEANPSREATLALIFVVMMSVVPANFPQGHELRYFMYWMISLVSINLYLVSHYERSPNNFRWLRSKYIGLVFALFLAIVLSKIGYFYAKPVFYSLDEHIQATVNPEVMSQINPGDEVCIIGKDGLLHRLFQYASEFHPELNYSYSVKGALNPKECAGLEKRFISL